MSRERFACGCIADARAWLQLCAAHRAEHDVMHAEALAGFALASGRVAEQDGATVEYQPGGLNRENT